MLQMHMLGFNASNASWRSAFCLKNIKNTLLTIIFGVPVFILYALLAAIKLHWEEGGNGLSNLMHLSPRYVGNIGCLVMHM